MDIKIDEKWFNLIKSGKKTIECRLDRGIYKSLKIGDQIRLVHDFKYHVVVITDIRRYKSFQDYLSIETLEKTLPGVETFQEGFDIYHKYYSTKDIEDFGVLALQL